MLHPLQLCAISPSEILVNLLMSVLSMPSPKFTPTNHKFYDSLCYSDATTPPQSPGHDSISSADNRYTDEELVAYLVDKTTGTETPIPYEESGVVSPSLQDNDYNVDNQNCFVAYLVDRKRNTETVIPPENQDKATSSSQKYDSSHRRSSSDDFDPNDFYHHQEPKYRARNITTHTESTQTPPQHFNFDKAWKTGWDQHAPASLHKRSRTAPALTSPTAKPTESKQPFNFDAAWADSGFTEEDEMLQQQPTAASASHVTRHITSRSCPQPTNHTNSQVATMTHHPQQRSCGFGSTGHTHRAAQKIYGRTTGRKH